MPFHVQTSSTEYIHYLYSVTDQRIYVETQNNTAGGIPAQTNNGEYYLINAAGNVVSIYNKANVNDATFYFYGADGRIGHYDTHLAKTTAYVKDYLGNTRITLTSADPANPIENVYDYLPYGDILKTHQTGQTSEKYLSTENERDLATGLDYRIARFSDPIVGRFLSVDPLAEQAPGWTPYRFGFNNPIRYTDPDGRWEWDAVGNLVAQKGDQSYSLAKFLGTSQKNAMTILNRGGVTANDKGVLNLKEGQSFAKNSLWVGFKSGSGAVVNNSKEATSHYFNGNGASADVGDASTIELLSSDKFQAKHTKITTQKVQAKGDFSVDLTNSTFHIGNTGVDYNVSGNGTSSSVNYTLFARDGFWDPDFIDEKVLGGWLGIDKYKPDGPEPNLERLGGKPYPYKTRERTYFFKPIEEQK